MGDVRSGSFATDAIGFNNPARGCPSQRAATRPAFTGTTSQIRDGGYVVLPPSIHPSGRPYVWNVDSADHFAEAPAWLSNLLTEKLNGHCHRQAKSPEHWHSVIANTIRNGARNSTLTSICRKLLHGGLTELAFLYDVMCCINLARCEEPLSEGEVHTIVASVARTHLKRLRGDA